MKLPRNTSSWFGDYPLCPWCEEPPFDLAIPMEMLLAHLARGFGHWVERGDDGSTDADIICDCPSCAKPFAVVLKEQGVILMAVRTATDLRLLAGEA